jgi:monofunctional biosynthetic peptidoglycan transglycosylase
VDIGLVSGNKESNRACPSGLYASSASPSPKWRSDTVRMMIRRLFSILFNIALVLALVPLLVVSIYAFVSPVSTLMLWRWATGERVVRKWQPIEAISQNLVRTVVVAEDARICSHSGVDWAELQGALDDADELSDARGASTIAMQTAKNLFLWPGRQYLRKAAEIPLAYYLTLVWSKRRLVEVYLNIVEWGPSGEFGAEAAARHAFRKSARELTSEEAALLAAALPNPHRRDARRPGPGLRRLAAHHSAEAEVAGAKSTACLESQR